MNNTLWKRECPICKNVVYHKSENSLKLAIKQNRKCLSCKYNSERRKKPYQKNCPQCNKIMIYKYASGFFNSLRNNDKCNSCSKLGTHPQRTNKKTKWKKQCIKCFSDMYYSTKDSRNRAEKNKTKCYDCANIEHRVTMVNKHNSLGYYPFFNLKACKIFEEINRELNWDGIYATNGGEYHIKELGYFVDYYEPNLNIVIEFDEEHHNLSKYIKRDIIREKHIKKYLKCQFYRIKENQIWQEVLLK